MKWLAVLATLALAVSCGPGQPTYLEGVRPMAVEKAHPLFQQLKPLIAESGRNPDELVRTWKEFLGDNARPLRKEGNVTFVYYDFTHTLDKVFMEASFAPQRFEPLDRVGNTSLFVRVYAVPKPDAARYRFSNGTSPLVDPFHGDLLPGVELWHPVGRLPAAKPVAQWIAGASEAALEGLDLHVLLPPSYRRNLGMTYPLVVVAGQEGTAWTDPLEQLMTEGNLRPIIVVSVGAPPRLKTVLEETVVPWMRARYRASPLPGDLLVVGWGTASKPVAEVAASRPDFWAKSWTPAEETSRDAAAWTTLAPPFFRSQYSAVTP